MSGCKVLAIDNQKGGTVAKTTSTVNLGTGWRMKVSVFCLRMQTLKGI